MINVLTITDKKYTISTSHYNSHGEVVSRLKRCPRQLAQSRGKTLCGCWISNRVEARCTMRQLPGNINHSKHIKLTWTACRHVKAQWKHTRWTFMFSIHWFLSTSRLQSRNRGKTELQRARLSQGRGIISNLKVSKGKENKQGGGHKKCASRHASRCASSLRTTYSCHNPLLCMEWYKHIKLHSKQNLTPA